MGSLFSKQIDYVAYGIAKEDIINGKSPFSKTLKDELTRKVAFLKDEFYSDFESFIQSEIESKCPQFVISPIYWGDYLKNTREKSVCGPIIKNMVDKKKKAFWDAQEISSKEFIEVTMQYYMRKI